MKLVLRNVTGETITLEVSPGDTFHDLKARIYEQTGIQLDLDLLNFKGRKISDEQIITKFFNESSTGGQLDMRTATIRAPLPTLPAKQVVAPVCVEDLTLAAIEECSVPSCPNAVTLCPGKSFFGFPDDPIRCQRWAMAVSRLDLLTKPYSSVSRYHAVCQDHFRADQFEDDLRLQLKIDADPCIFEMKEEVIGVGNKIMTTNSAGSPRADLNGVKNEMEEEVKDEQESSESDAGSDGMVFNDEEVVSDSDQRPLCRLCARHIDGDAVFIFSDNGREIGIAQKINMSLPVTIRSGDRLPKQLCTECMEKLDLVSGFSQDCVSAQLKLHSLSRRHSFRVGPVEALAADELPPHTCPLCRNGDMSCGDNELALGEMMYIDGPDMVDSEEEDGSEAGVRLCRLCPESFTSKEACVTHALAHGQPGHGFPCIICEFVAVDEAKLRSHVQEHRQVDLPGWGSVACGLCPQVFRHAEALSVHVARVHNLPHGGRPTPISVVADCDICGGRFPSAGALKEHRNEHVSPKPFICNACDRSFARKSLFSQHLMVHVTDDLSRQQRVCKTCGEVVAGTYVKLLEHKKLRHQETVQRVEPTKPFRCEECGKTFAYRVTLVTHLRKHTGELPFECHYCEKRFSQKRSLVLHERTHTGEKPFECEVCGKRFAQSAHMYSHVRLHTGEKPYRCGHCSATFRLKDVRDAHVRKHTGERPYRCEVCEKTFRTSHSYYQHMWIHQGKKPYPCSFCGKAFRRSNGLKIHVRIHTGEKPHACEVCGRGFAQKQDMKKHLNLHLTGRL